MDGRWAARLALVAGTAALAVLLVFAGPRSIALLLVGLTGVIVAAAGVWWMLAYRGPARAFGALLVVTGPVVVLVFYALAGLLWVVIVSAALWALAIATGRAALAAETGRPDGGRASGGAAVTVRPVGPAKHPFLIMNPRSGGGKVGKFHLVDRARALGAEVVVLDPAYPQDVAELARRAVEDGADLLGVAGGDGTQALVSGVAAACGVPFMVISAGTRNHFAMDLGLDRDDPSTCLEALTDGVELRIDLGFVGERVFVNNASFGAYAAVVQSPEYRDDKVGTTMELLPGLLTHQSGPRLAVRAGPVTIDGPQAVLVSNNPYETEDRAGLGRRERLDSGVLGVLGVKVDNAAQAAGMLRGLHSPGLTVVTAREVIVDADAPAIDAGIDGEALTLPTPVRCRIEPKALLVRLPRHRPGVPRAKPRMNWRRVWRLALTAAGKTGKNGSTGEDGKNGRTR